MTRAQEIRKEVLFQLYGGKEVPCAPTLIVRRAKREGLDYTETEVRDALYFLKGQGFAELVSDETTGQQKYRITSRGMIQYEQQDSPG